MTPHSIVVFGTETGAIGIAEIARERGKHLLDFHSPYARESILPAEVPRTNEPRVWEPGYWLGEEGVR